MKYISLLTLLFIFSCNQKKNDLVAVENSLIKQIILKTDTLKLSFDKDLIENDWVLIHLLEKKYKKDSILDATYRFDFYRNSKRVKQKTIVLKDVYKEVTSWYSGYVFDKETPTFSSFLRISNGYEACGYPQTHFLFYTENDSFEIIDEYETFSDSGYGSYVEFFEKNENFIISITTSFSPDEESNSDEAMGFVAFSDSIHFELKNNKWAKTYCTPKDTIYRKNKISFNEFHNIKE